ncbi:putative mucin TcMUCII [Trypanosoma cruzi]|nr:putative mucin TcMUCII [Trypanosoma cruzi]
MMTCRLLCALLVLALCCCPSVCVTGTGKEQGGVNGSTAAQPPGASVPGPGGTESRSTSSTAQTQSVNPTPQASSAGTGVPGSPDTPSPGSIPKQEQAISGATGRSGLQISTGADQAKGENDPLNKPDTTTTNTTNAPAKTTTTTTTTTAPEATSTTTTTTTEAPTTTTTRAPSLLREIDGSLSSSAWVCAPLLLAVSALAYTTLG